MKHLSHEEFDKRMQLELERARRKQILGNMMQVGAPPPGGQSRLASILGGQPQMPGQGPGMPPEQIQGGI